MMESSKNNYAKYIKYIAAFVFIWALSFLFPYTGDDLAWGTKFGLNLLASKFQGYNGRYLGNLIVLALTRSHALKATAMAGCITSIGALIERIIGKAWAFYITIFMILIMPIPVFREAWVWTSGFSNYITSILLVLIYLTSVYKYFDREEGSEPPKNNLKLGCAFLLLGFATTLIIEHITIYSFILAVFVLLYVGLTQHKILIQHVMYAIGVLLGTFVMFSNPAYYTVAEGGDEYRSMFGDAITTRILENYDIIFSNGYASNAALLLAYVVVITLLWRTNKKNAVFSLVYAVFILTTLLLLVANIKYDFDHTSGRSEIVIKLSALISIFTLFALSIYYGYLNQGARKVILFVTSACAIIGPLFLVTPIGPRNFFPSYIFLILLLFELCTFLPEDALAFMEDRKFTLLTLAGSLAIYVFLFSIYFDVYSVEQARIAKVKDAVSRGEKVVEVEPLPHEDYLWLPNPSTKRKPEYWEKRFKQMHGIPEDVDLILLWMEK